MYDMELMVHSIFCDGMVLAEKKPVRIFGTGNGNVTVCFLGLTAETVGTEDHWLIEFPPQRRGGPYTMEIYLNDEKKILQDIYIGKVILLAGQSNMQFKLWESTFAGTDAQGCPMLRLYTPERLEANEFYHPEDGWVPCRKENAVNWSAIGYYSGIELCRRCGCAVGLVVCYQGASIIESWMPAGTMERLGVYLSMEALHPDHTNPLYAIWNKDGVLYETMVRRIAPFSISDVIWYQGESNTTPEEGRIYDTVLSEMIRIWRRDFHDAELPFTIVQISDFDDRRDDGWHAVQKAQMRISRHLSMVKTVVSADICETDNIHPPTKDVLARRIADTILSFDGAEKQN